jgi:hypothetical protein
MKRTLESLVTIKHLISFGSHQYDCQIKHTYVRLKPVNP